MKKLTIIFLLSFLWNLTFILWCQIIRDSRPMIAVTIPESTKAFLDSIGSQIFAGEDNVIIVEVDSIDDDEWTNIIDYGNLDENGLYVYDSDSLFILYSDINDSNLFAQTLSDAHDAVIPLADLMGQYVYPYQIKGRKLPIYICSLDGTYQKVCQELSSSNSDFSGTWGLHVSSYCGTETITKGIILNRENILETSSSPALDIKATIWHEMNHYVFFQSIDLSKELTLYTWLYEGLADYFSSIVKEDTKSLTNSQKQEIKNNTLESSFNPFLCNYYGGEVFYDYTESAYGKQNVLDMVQLIYTMPLPDAFSIMNKDIVIEEKQWKEYALSMY